MEERPQPALCPARSLGGDQSKGIAGKINKLALQAFELAAKHGEEVIDERLVELVLDLR